jgi:hypothetical protein
VANCSFFILLIKRNNYPIYLYDNRNSLDLIHFQSLYPSLAKQTPEENFGFKQQTAIGICINFNYDPDQNGYTLASILSFYTKINKHILIITPSLFNKLSNRNLELFYQFNVKSIEINNRTSNNSHLSFINDQLNTTTTLYHIKCTDGRSGQLQHKCMLLCAQFYKFVKAKYSNLRGILYLSDDLYFNFAYVFSHPERFSLDEIWTTPSTQLLDIIRDVNAPSGNRWWWWTNRPQFWNSFRHFFLSKSETHQQYQRIFEILYGPNKRLAIANADLLYLPFADDQLTTFISVTNQFMKFFRSDIFCEIIFSLIIDTTMALSGHWPFQNDQYIFNSSINRLNNLSIIQQMERTTNLIKNARDPYSLNVNYRQRPCLFNPGGFIWDHHRSNRQLFEKAIFNGTVPTTKQFFIPWKHRTEFIHPIKLSKANQWPFQLWHQGIILQIEQLYTYQLYQTKVY